MPRVFSRTEFVSPSTRQLENMNKAQAPAIIAITIKVTSSYRHLSY